MSTEANKATIRRFIEEMLNAQQLEVAGDLFTADYIDHDSDDPDGRPSGIEGAKAEVGAFLSAFPDIKVNIDDLVAEGDKAIVRGSFSGTQRGDFFGIPATGKSVNVWVWQTYRLVDGKIAEGWLHVDRLALLQQLGVIPAPGQAVAS